MIFSHFLFYYTFKKIYLNFITHITGYYPSIHPYEMSDSAQDLVICNGETRDINSDKKSQAKNMKPRLNYENKMIMAPMVKIGTTPARLVALEYGADIVYTEEIIDWRLLRSTRVENPVLNTIDYIDRYINFPI